MKRHFQNEVEKDCGSQDPVAADNYERAGTFLQPDHDGEIERARNVEAEGPRTMTKSTIGAEERCYPQAWTRRRGRSATGTADNVCPSLPTLAAMTRVRRRKETSLARVQPRPSRAVFERSHNAREAQAGGRRRGRDLG